jgi:hypothetical protein
MAAKRKPKWNPNYKKVWVRIALQNALSKDEHDGISIAGKKLIKLVLEECDIKAKEQEEQNG